MGNVVLDDQMIPGGTYTFTYALGNLFSMPSTGTINQQLISHLAPYISSVSVTYSSPNVFSLLSNYVNVTFTYTGDGSDVVSDVRDEILTAITSSSDDWSFVDVSETGGNASPGVGISETANVYDIAQQAGNTVGSVAGGILGGATKGVVTQGWPFLIVLALGFVAYILFATGGLRGR